MSETDPGFLAALEEGKKGAAEGGVPIGACLVSKDGKILGQGHNMRVQNGSAILHVSTSTNPMVLLTSTMDSPHPGRNVRSPKLRPIARRSVRGRNNVHNPLAV
jgi:hypothetical protein